MRALRPDAQAKAALQRSFACASGFDGTLRFEISPRRESSGLVLCHRLIFGFNRSAGTR